MEKMEVFHSYWRACEVGHTYTHTTGIGSKRGVQGQPWVCRVWGHFEPSVPISKLKEEAGDESQAGTTAQASRS